LSCSFEYQAVPVMTSWIHVYLRLWGSRLKVLELAWHAGCQYIQPIAHGQQVVTSVREGLIKWGYLWCTGQNGAQDGTSLYVGFLLSVSI